MNYLFKKRETSATESYFFRDTIQATTYKVVVDVGFVVSYAIVSYLDRKSGWIQIFQDYIEIPDLEEDRIKAFDALLTDAKRLLA